MRSSLVPWATAVWLKFEGRTGTANVGWRIWTNQGGPTKTGQPKQACQSGSTKVARSGSKGVLGYRLEKLSLSVIGEW